MTAVCRTQSGDYYLTKLFQVTHAESNLGDWALEWIWKLCRLPLENCNGATSL